MKLRARQGRGQQTALRVLLVDDSATVRQMLKRLFKALPQFQVVGQAIDGSQALKAIAQLEPDVVILDIRLPGIGGLEVLEKLQQQRSPCAVLVFSQFGEDIYRQKCLQLGAKGFFDKISDFDRFHQHLKNMEKTKVQVEGHSPGTAGSGSGRR